MKKVCKPSDIYTSRGITIRKTKLKSMVDVYSHQETLRSSYEASKTAYPFKNYEHCQCRIDGNTIHRCKAMHWLINVNPSPISHNVMLRVQCIDYSPRRLGITTLSRSYQPASSNLAMINPMTFYFLSRKSFSG